MATLKHQKLPISNRIQVLLNSTIRSPMKTLLTFIMFNFTTYILYCFINKEKAKLPISPIVKYISQMNLPTAVRKPLYKLYGKVYGVNLEEIKAPLQDHKSFIDFFCREVKQRKINPDEKTFISPCDSKILNFGEITENYTQVVKGYKYSLGKFLTGQDVQLSLQDLSKLKKNKQNKMYHVVLYLSPGDYHRFHSPTKFQVVQKQYYGQQLYPVYPKFLAKSKKAVYEANKRTCLVGKSSTGYMNVILVGAQNVGQIVIHEKREFQKGEELGMFKLGSTIVMIFEAPETLTWCKNVGDKIRFGQQMYKV